MGMYATAEVFYGYDLGDLTDRETFEFIGPAWIEDDGTEWQDKLAAVRGIVEVPFPVHLADEHGRCDRSHPDYAAWSEYRDRVRALERESPVELDTYGHEAGDWAWCVKIKASVVRSEYDCVPLDLTETVGPGSQWNLDLAEFVRALELPVGDREPCWLVSSSYG